MPFIDSKRIPGFSKTIDPVKQAVTGAVKKLIPDTAASTGQTVPSATQTNPTTYNATPKAFSGDYASKQNELFGNLESTMKTPFQYNPETDPAYQAQRQLAQLRAKDANKATMETMNERGLLQSTMTNSQLDQNNQRAEQEALAYIPQFREQAYGQYQDRINNASNLLSTARTLGNDQFDRSVTEANLTGNYLSDKDKNAQPLLKNLVAYGQEFGNASPERQAELRKLANDTRAQLSQMGVDPSLYDSNLSTEQRQAALGKLGTRTLAAQQQDYAQQVDQRDFEENKQRYGEEFAYKKARDKIADAQEKARLDEDVRQFGISAGIQRFNAETSRASNQLSKDRFDYEKEQDAKIFDYTKDPRFADAVQGVQNDPNALANIKANAAKLIADFGQKGYDDLLRYATPEKKSTNDVLSQLFGQ